MKNRIFTIFCLALLTYGVRAQVTLEQCYEAARANYPLIAQRGLIEQSRDYSLKNASTAYYPQLGLSARATWQSAVTTVPLPTATPMPRDQFQIVASLNQNIWDGGATHANKRGIAAAAEVENKRLEVEIYALTERVENLYFGILMLDEQLRTNSLLVDELNRNLVKVESYLASGVANSADVDAVRVEILNNRQNRAAIEASRAAYSQMLSAMVGFEVDSVVKPDEPIVEEGQNLRPELSLFDAQVESAEAQRLALRSNLAPKLGLFVQGAYGNPGLDMLKPGATLYAIGGANLTWNFSALYTNRRDVAKANVLKKSADVQRNTFLYNTSLQTTQIGGELRRLDMQMVDDDQIIVLRGRIKRSAEAKVEGGTMTVTDMLREVTAENAAIQSRALHQLERLMYLFSMKTKLNN